MRNNKWFSILIAWVFLFTQVSYGANFTDDTIQIGKPGSSADKSVIFGASNKKKLSHKPATGTLDYEGNNFSVGDGTNATNKTITFNKGANSPSIRYNFTTGEIEFSNDNVNFSAIGSGSGGAGGIQMLSDGEFEKTPISSFWTASAGTLTALTSGVNFSGFGKQSASWVPAAATNTLSSEAVTIVNGLVGMRGTANIYYKTASALHKLQVFDGTTVLAEKLLPVASSFKKEEFSFFIPTSGTIRLRILAGDTTAIYADKAYMGPPIVTPVEEDFSVVKNLFPNNKAEGSSDSWLAYKDAAGTAPVDGLGGSPTLGCSISTTSPIEGTRSFLITKPASNVQGEGCAHNLKPMEGNHKARVLQVSFDYQIASGTYADDALKLYAYDIDNAQMIELAPTFIKNSSLVETYRAVFQTTLTGTNYRLIWHYAATDTVANSIRIDNLRVATQTLATGSAVTDWQSYPCAWTASTTNPTLGNGNLRCRYRIVGDAMDVDIVLTYGSTTTYGSGQYFLSLPFAVDTTKYASLITQPADELRLGTAAYHDAGSTIFSARAYLSSTTQLSVRIQDAASTLVHVAATQWQNNQPVTPATNDQMAIRVLSLPIAGKTSNTFLASEYNSQLAGFKASGNPSSSPGLSNGVTTQISWPNIDNAQGFSYNPSTGEATALVGGLFSCEASIRYAGTYASNAYAEAWLEVNGNAVKYNSASTSATSGSFMAVNPVINNLQLRAGDVVRMKQTTFNWTSLGFASGGSYHTFSCMRAGGSPLLSMSETVAVRGTNTAGTVINNSGVTVPYTVNEATHSGLWSGTVFTALISGWYQYNFSAFSTSTLNSSTSWYFTVMKNGSTQINQDDKAGTGAPNTGNQVKVSGAVYLKAGETLQANSSLDTATSITLNTGAGQNSMSIIRVGL